MLITAIKAKSLLDDNTPHTNTDRKQTLYPQT